MKKYFIYINALILFVFASMTFFMSASVIFDLFDIRAKQGNYVLFVVIANFICSIIYFIAVYGFLKRKSWTFLLLFLAVLLLIGVFIWFTIYINAGGLHEAKTVSALKFRLSVTIVFSVLAYLLTYRNKNIIK